MRGFVTIRYDFRKWKQHVHLGLLLVTMNAFHVLYISERGLYDFIIYLTIVLTYDVSS